MKENTELAFIRNRKGEYVEFNGDKILSAIKRAGEATSEFDEEEAKVLKHEVVKILRHQAGDDKRDIDVEHIQDTVEQVLIAENYTKTAHAYIAYREQHNRLRKDKETLVAVESTMNEYLGRSDWRVNANANQGYSIGGLILNVAGKITANYWLNHVYPKEIGLAHRNADFHIHDLDMLSGYCAGWSLKTLLLEGFNGVSSKIEAKPPKHLSSAIGQMVNFLGTLQNEWAGAQAFSSFDTYLAPYVRVDNLNYEQVKQHIQEFIYNLNVPSRWGTQTPFTNVTFDLICPDDLKEQVVIISGKEMPFHYGDLQKEMDMINRAYIEVMTKGDKKGRIFTFPIPTYNIGKDFDWDSPIADALFEMTAKYGCPYFQNFVNSDLSPKMVRSMCCRLQLDLRELLKRGNGLFGSAEQTGSIGVVTINCPRLGYLYKGNLDELYKHLDYLLDLAKNSLEIKRKTISKYLDAGIYPFTKRYLGSFRNHFSTIGVNGINEMIRNFSDDKDDITTPDGKRLALEFLDHIRAKLVAFQEETNHMYNLEATPAEGTTYRFAKEDKKRFGDKIIQAGTPDAPYYTNSSQTSVAYSDDLFAVLENQEDLQRKYTGGTVMHLYVGENIKDGQACKNLLRKVLTNYKLPYVSITPTFSICPTHGYIKGEHFKCPECGSDCEVWTRVMGYYRPVSEFNRGKKSEFKERIYYKVEEK